MAHIPYGYKIEGGLAVIIPEEAEKLQTFLDIYLKGSSIQASAKSAGLPHAPASLRRMLSNPLYLGTDYYPPIVAPETFAAVQTALAQRTHPGHTKPPQVIPVYTKFVLTFPEGLLSPSPHATPDHVKVPEDIFSPNLPEIPAAPSSASTPASSPSSPESLSAQEVAAYLYSLISPSEAGHPKATREELALFFSWQHQKPRSAR